MTQSSGRFADASREENTHYFVGGSSGPRFFKTEVVHYVRALYRGTAGLLLRDTLYYSNVSPTSNFCKPTGKKEASLLFRPAVDRTVFVVFIFWKRKWTGQLM